MKFHRSIPLCLLAVLLAATLLSCRREGAGRKDEKGPTVSAPAPAAPGPWRELRYPTDQESLLSWETPGVLMPSSGEDPRNGSYGSVRSERVAKRILAAFHEGIDIAPLSHVRRGRAADEVRAIAEGRVEYFNRYPGNSDYGTYIVLAHEDALGTFYSLYAHLARAADGIKAGKAVKAGETLGGMGNTSGGYKIPLWKSHLHLEIDLMLNSRFRSWQKSQKMVPDHGNANGWNLVGIDPLSLYRQHRDNPDFAFADVIDGVPVAFEIVVQLAKIPDYFDRYPGLWNVPDFAGGAVVISCSENGLPLAARAADPEEEKPMVKKNYAIVGVDEETLGRNGARIIVKSRGRWDLGTAGKRWLSILTF
jgi:murein DD-endopeptidase MepM/ murein hydrolase activator NlpD